MIAVPPMRGTIPDPTWLGAAARAPQGRRRAQPSRRLLTDGPRATPSSGSWRRGSPRDERHRPGNGSPLVEPLVAVRKSWRERVGGDPDWSRAEEDWSPTLPCATPARRLRSPAGDRRLVPVNDAGASSSPEYATTPRRRPRPPLHRPPRGPLRRLRERGDPRSCSRGARAWRGCSLATGFVLDMRETSLPA